MTVVSQTARSSSSMIPNYSAHITHHTISRGVPKQITVPTEATYAFFSCTGSFYADFLGGISEVPTGDSTTGDSSCLNPTVRNISGRDTFSIMLAQGKSELMTIEWYS